MDAENIREEKRLVFMEFASQKPLVLRSLSVCVEGSYCINDLGICKLVHMIFSIFAPHRDPN